MESISTYDLPTLDKIGVIRGMLPMTCEGTALDIGIGTGYTTYNVFGDRPTVCLDLHQPNLLYYKDRVGEMTSSPQTHYTVGQATALPYRSESFQYVLCSEVLEHLEDDDAAIEEIARVMAPDGRAILTVPYSGLGFTGFLELLRIKTVHDYPGPEFHVRPGYDEQSMNKLLARHGLEAEQYSYYLRFFTKVIVDAVSLAHIAYERCVKHRQSWTWSEAAEAENSSAFRAYTKLFPALQTVAKADRFLSRGRGFGLVACVRKATNGNR